MESKHPAIAAELRRRLKSGRLKGRLPTSLELAREFGVNVKTLNKAMHTLAAEGLLERRRRGGTRTIAPGGRQERRIEVIFEGYTTVFSHPFWRDIWSGMVEQLGTAGFLVVLNMLESDRATGLLRLESFNPGPADGRILLGVMEKRLLDAVVRTGVPWIVAGDRLEDSGLPQIGFDFSAGMAAAVDYLVARSCRAIGFIGQASSFVDNGALHKFDAYRKAIQRHCQLPAGLIADVRPLGGNGAAGLAGVLRRGRPDALIVGNDTLLPEILQMLAERRLRIPVVGCDGLSLPGVPERRPMIRAPLRRCGELAAQKLMAAVVGGSAVEPGWLEAVFVPPETEGPARIRSAGQIAVP